MSGYCFTHDGMPKWESNPGLLGELGDLPFLLGVLSGDRGLGFCKETTYFFSYSCKQDIFSQN